ncbi:MAG: hypothetical protein B7Y99_10095 [Caulobacterales bacterium 32-69-10]|nr:MAG: hypothetical protein B7Y99_10095 [Caulobacterales bacterium 32-69-10]
MTRHSAFRLSILVAFGLALGLLGWSQPAAAAPDVVLRGVLQGADKQTYRELPFTVPAGVGKITVDVSWAGRERGTILVLGLLDPERLRGWGGGTKPHFFVANAFASPSYLPGPINPGVWRLTMAVASIRAGETSPYVVNITYGRGPDAQVIADTPVKSDLHTHTGQSDGRCRSLAGQGAPCPTFLTLKAAAEHGLDFVAVTDHNTASHVAELAGLTPYFDTLLVIPGREMTTQFGHYNLLGVADFVEFRLGSPATPNINAMFDASKATGAVISINHPERSTGEDCLGCGWSAPDTDYDRVQSIEVANGGGAADNDGRFGDGPGSGVAIWEALLNRGYRLTGVGGSDNHDAVDGRRGTSPVGAQSPVGMPATVVYADALSQPAILQGVRSGRMFVDLEGARPGRVLDLSAAAGEAEVAMGGVLKRTPGQPIQARLRVAGAEGDHIEVIVDGRRRPVLADPVLHGADQTLAFGLPADSVARWFRIDVRAPDGRRVLIGNPIYVGDRQRPDR